MEIIRLENNVLIVLPHIAGIHNYHPCMKESLINVDLMVDLAG